MKWQIRGLGACLSLVFSLALPWPVAAQSNDPRLEKIFQDWERRREAVRSVRYTVEGQQVYPKGSQNEVLKAFQKPSKDPFPPREITCEQKWTLLIDFSNGRYRLDADDEECNLNNATDGPGQRPRNVGTALFDGSVVKHFHPPRDPKMKTTGDPSSKDPDLIIDEGDLKNQAFMADYWPFFVGHGIISTMYHEIAPKTMLDKPDIELFFIHGQGVHQGRACLVVRSHPQRRDATVDELWVDPARDSAIVRQLQVHSDGNPFTESDIQYQQTPKGWLPKSWVFNLYTSGKKIVRQERMRVTELDLDCAVTDADFTVEERPGMLIVRNKNGKPINPVYPRVLEKDQHFYRVTEGGTRAEVVFDNGVEHRRWPQLWLWWLLGLVAVVALAGWLVYRRRSLKRLAPGEGGNHATTIP